MIIAYKVKHNRDFSKELLIAKKVADFAIQNRDKLSSKYVKHLGLKAVIANQILWKYGRNRKAKKVNSVKLIIPGQNLRIDGNNIKVIPLDLDLLVDKKFDRVHQVEFGEKYAYISISVKEVKPIRVKKHLGVDLNTTGHCAVIAIKETGKVYKLGKNASYIHNKYKQIRKRLQKKELYGVVKKIKNRESRIVRDINHKISRFIVDKAVENKAEIKLENLKGIRKHKGRRSFKYALNSWSYYQLGQFIQYKALLAGIPVSFIEPAYTSKACSRCGLVGERNGKVFKCSCGHADNADINAAFNIAMISPSIIQLQKDKRFLQAEIDTRRMATQ